MSTKNLKNLGKKLHFNKLLHFVIISVIIILTTYVLISSANSTNNQERLFKELEIHMLKEEVQLDSIHKRIDSIKWETNLHK